MAADPSDEDVKNAILSALGELNADKVRPNKLRKIVCKSVEGASWTQFQVNLDSLIDSGRVRAGEGGDGGRVLLVKSSLGGGKISSEKEISSAASAKKSEREVCTKSVEIRLPRGVALHLTKKSHLKQKNIEKNTKTKLYVNGKELRKNNISTGTGDDELTLTITAAMPSNEDNRQDSAEVIAAIDRRLKAATVLIEQMIKAYTKHPDHFVPRMAGGTFEQQAIEKKRKHDALQRRQWKRTKGKDVNNRSGKKEVLSVPGKTSRKGLDTNTDTLAKRKKKRRKFF